MSSDPRQRRGGTREDVRWFSLPAATWCVLPWMRTETHPASVCRIQFGLIVAATIGLCVSLIDPPYPRQQPLQHTATVIGLAALVWVARRRWLSSVSFTCAVAFVLLHIVGARWTYSNVPYDDWSNTLVGFALTEVAEFERNHYDRLVHFAFGLLVTVPIIDRLRRGGRGAVETLLFAFSLSMTASAVYEVFEWLLAVTMSPETATRYNGQQGDPWDAQRDMALAGLGAAIACVAATRWFERAGNQAGPAAEPACRA